MKRFAILACCFAFALITVQARANIDPSIGLGDPTCYGDPPNNYTGGTLTFSSNSAGGGFVTFCNDTGHTLTFVDVKFINTPGYVLGDINCVSTAGYTCTETFGSTIDLLFTLTSGHGIRDDHTFTFNLNNNQGLTDPNGIGGWGSSQTFFAAGNQSATVIPEPASMLLVGSGLLGLWQLRRRRA